MILKIYKRILILYQISIIFLNIMKIITTKKIKNQKINILIQTNTKKIQTFTIYEKE